MDAASSPPFKVWGIGLSRTATTSLSAALHQLGWRCAHNPDAESMLAGMTSGSFPVLDRYDAATDISTAIAFRQLDAAFPASKFILTVRDADSWLRSVINHFDNLPHQLDAKPSGRVRQLLYRSPRPSPQQFLDAYRAHLTTVARYFADRPNDLLVMDITAGEGWQKLCPFLGVDVPSDPFPRNNATDPANNTAPPPGADMKLSLSELQTVFKEWSS